MRSEGVNMADIDNIKAPNLFDSRDIRDEIDIIEGDESIAIATEVCPIFSYSLYVNSTHLVKEIRVKNNREKDIYDLILKITSDNNLVEPYSQSIPMINAGQEILIRRPKLLAHAPALLSLNESTECLIKISIYYKEKEVAIHNDSVQILAHSEYPGNDVGDPRILASFVLPNNPAVEKIRQEAAEYLKDFTGDPSFTGYQGPVEISAKRVVSMAAAIYYAIQKKNIVYSEPPASFGKRQKIRFPDEILNTRFGTCMDMSLFYVACLEMSGLNPILIITPGHIFAGVWLINDLSISAELTNDNSLIEKKVAEGINELIVIECTEMCSGSKCTFDNASLEARKKLNEVEYYLDIALCRKDNIIPLPIRNNEVIDISSDKNDLSSDEEVAVAPSLDISDVDITSELKPTTELTRIEQWERKLLDFSMRNHLLNMRTSTSMIPILVDDLSVFEDMLASEQSFDLIQRPEDWKSHDISSGTFETFNNLHEYSKVINDSLKQNKVHSLLDETVLSKNQTKLYRSSKESVEENGVNNLYLALGVLRWFDYTKSGKAAKTPHYAPIILIPIDFIRKPTSVSYAIKQRDEEALVNQTLLEFLKQQFGMDITGLNPPPTDNSGIDVLKVLTIIRRAIMERANWTVIDCAFISSFSFAQFMMWNDLHCNADIIMCNKIVRSLSEGSLTFDYTTGEEADNDEALVPIQVDASQLHAIKMAAHGESFVLHGPPGTGKSQTITAMIANALYKGKKVLFVAEKKAALDVVYRRLKNIGIEDFCLELHSNKAQKSKVLNQLKRCIEGGQNLGSDSAIPNRIDEIKEMSQELDAYVNVLHKTHKCGMNIRELIDAYESIPEYESKIQINKQTIRELTKDDLDKQQKLLENLYSAGSLITDFRNNPLYGVKQTEYSQSLRRSLENFYSDYINTLNGLVNSGNTLSRTIGWNSPCSFTEWQELIALSLLLLGQTIDRLPSNNSRLQRIFDVITRSKNSQMSFAQFNTSFCAKYNESILSLDLDSLFAEYASAQKKVIGKQKAIDLVKGKLQQHLKIPADFSIIESIKADILRYSQLKTEQVNSMAEANSLWNGNYEILAKYATDLLDAYSRVQSKESEFCQLLVTDIPNIEQDWLSARKSYIESICENASNLRDWIYYQSVRSECCKSGIEQLCQLYENGIDPKDILPMYLKSVYQELIWEFIDESPTLNAFNGNIFDYHIEQFKKAEDEYLKFAKQELYRKLSHGSSLGVIDTRTSQVLLNKAISSGGRGISLRSLFDRIGQYIISLCPCFLMSPMSVAQYISADIHPPFDLVIFDEASQVPTAQAIGALARATDAVIVGDSKQMPPTSFFSSDLSDDDMNQLDNDLDSILEDCLAICLPESHLLWHYRSKHESLIAFSNKNYYENKLFTFPSANERERCVKICTVNGTYARNPEKKSDRGKNVKEAEAVVKELKRRFNSPLLHDQSIGIVTFNIKQRELIKDLIDEECKKDPAFDTWVNPQKALSKDKAKNFDDDTEELFVKNLENVQGDERDVILFSIGFGPDESGKVYYNFGPLNQVGGWRRLNVAVSRARYEMIVFSSMSSDMIDINRSANEGVKQLHDFLKFAETGVLGDDIGKENFHTKGITLQICKALQDAGFKTQKNVGSSDLKIDVAVVNPYNDGEYLLGILLDGDTYRKAQNTKDREISQQSILEGLGWNTYRIWTMDWWDSKKRKIDNLLEYVEKCRAQAEANSLNPTKKDPGPESEELIPREVLETKRESKKKEQVIRNSSFEMRDRFTIEAKPDTE